MNEDVNYSNNPLHGLSLKNLLVELVDQYGFEILYAYLNINCFKINPSIESSVKFLKKTEWARHKVEVLYLYDFKNLPRASSEQFALPPRDRIIPDDQVPGEPALLSLEDAERLREKRERKAKGHTQNNRQNAGRVNWSGSKSSSNYSDQKEVKQAWTNKPEKTNSSSDVGTKSPDPWAKWN